MITAADVIDYLIDDEHTRVICLFLEQIGDPAAFAAAAQRADQAGKPIVALKAGSSAAGSRPRSPTPARSPATTPSSTRCCASST